MNKNIIIKAVKIIREGGIIAYPTEAVFGLGCDPFNEKAVQKILRLKNRPMDKGLILIISKWEQAKNLVIPVNPELLSKIFIEQLPTTWVFPAASIAPPWVIGSHNSIALRITKHPIAKALCDAFNGPLVSTSANIEGNIPARTVSEVQHCFPKDIDFIVEGKVGNLKQPTMIRDVLTNKILRNG